MQKAIAYIRVSTDRQAVKGVSLAAQRASHDGDATPPAMIPRSVMPGALDLRRHPPAASKPVAQRRSPMSTMGVVSKRMVECLVYRLDRHSRLKFAFDVETHALRWIEARDTTTNSVAVVEIHAYHTTDGARVATDVEVHGGGLDYRDTLTDWEIH